MDESVNLNGMIDPSGAVSSTGPISGPKIDVPSPLTAAAPKPKEEVKAEVKEAPKAEAATGPIVSPVIAAPVIEVVENKEAAPAEKAESTGAAKQSAEGVDSLLQEIQEEGNFTTSYAKNEAIFSNMDFGPLKPYLDDDNVTDISYSNHGQVHLKTLDKGIYRIDEPGINDALLEKIAFQCANVMGKSFNMAHPFLDAESAELRMNFVHSSIARNGIAAVFRKTPAKIRLKREKLLEENYVTLDILDFLISAVKGHCNILVCGETGSGKTELVKYLAAHTAENEKLITIEDTLELHLDRIYPTRDIVAMKTNNVASYSDVLVTCMRQNPKWILLSEVRSAEAVLAVRNSISSGHNILSTLHADKASNIPERLYSLLESNSDLDQFLGTIYRYVQLGVMVRGRYSAQAGRFVREVAEVCEFYVDDNNKPVSNIIYKKAVSGFTEYNKVSDHLIEYLEGQNVDVTEIKKIGLEEEKEKALEEEENQDAALQKEVKTEAAPKEATKVEAPSAPSPAKVEVAAPAAPEAQAAPAAPEVPAAPAVQEAAPASPAKEVATPAPATQAVSPKPAAPTSAPAPSPAATPAPAPAATPAAAPVVEAPVIQTVTASSDATKAEAAASSLGFDWPQNNQ